MCRCAGQVLLFTLASRPPDQRTPPRLRQKRPSHAPALLLFGPRAQARIPYVPKVVSKGMVWYGALRTFLRANYELRFRAYVELRTRTFLLAQRASDVANAVGQTSFTAKTVHATDGSNLCEQSSKARRLCAKLVWLGSMAGGRCLPISSQSGQEACSSTAPSVATNSQVREYDGAHPPVCGYVVSSCHPRQGPFPRASNNT